MDWNRSRAGAEFFATLIPKVNSEYKMFVQVHLELNLLKFVSKFDLKTMGNATAMKRPPKMILAMHAVYFLVVLLLRIIGG